MMWGPGVSRAAADLVADRRHRRRRRHDPRARPVRRARPQPARHRPDRPAVPRTSSTPAPSPKESHDRRAIKSVLYDVQERRARTFMEDSGWVWTTTFGDAQAEYDAVREAAGDVGRLRPAEVGRDAARTRPPPSSARSPATVATLAVGQVKYGAVRRRGRPDGRRRHRLQARGRPLLGDHQLDDVRRLPGRAAPRAWTTPIENRTLRDAGDLRAGARARARSCRA